MKHVVWKAYYDYEKEEKYLNNMSAKGLALTDYSWCRYVFEEAPRGEYIYRIQLLEHPIKHPESQNYIRFMEEIGVEFVASFNRWVYFRKKAADGEFDIYSDIDSKIKHYKRILLMFSLITAVEFLVGLFNLHVGITEASRRLSSINIYIAFLPLVVGVLFLIFLVLPLSNKIKKLKKEKDIRE